MTAKGRWGDEQVSHIDCPFKRSSIKAAGEDDVTDHLLIPGSRGGNSLTRDEWEGREGREDPLAPTLAM